MRHCLYRLAPGHETPHDDVQHGNKNQVQRRRGNRSAKDRGSDGNASRAARALRQHQWHNTENERQ